MTDAYWISPEGMLIPVKTTHISEIIDNPECYGLTKEYIENVYKKYGERLRIEAKAREEIMRELVNKGWIRIRYYPKHDSYNIELKQFSKTEKKYLFEWVVKTIEDNPVRKYSDTSMRIYSTDTKVNCPLSDLLNKNKI